MICAFGLSAKSVNLATKQMGLNPNFSVSPYAPLIPEQRWFPADETMRATPVPTVGTGAEIP